MLRRLQTEGGRINFQWHVRLVKDCKWFELDRGCRYLKTLQTNVN